MFLRILFLGMITTWSVGAIASLVAGKGVIARGAAALGAGIGSAAYLLLGLTALVTGQSLTFSTDSDAKVSFPSILQVEIPES